MQHNAHPLANIPASFPLGLRWYAIYTHIRAEKRAGEAINDLGYQTFIPLEKRIQRAPGKKPRPYETALFPRYGFVQFEINDDRWGEITDADGVVDIVRSNNIPRAIPQSIIDGLKLADSMGLLDRTMPAKVGGMVEATAGPFSGIVGKILRARSGDRVDVLLNMFGTEVTTTMQLTNLREA